MMEQEPDKQQEQTVAEPQPVKVGVTLREARERAGLTVEDVVNRLKFAPRQIRALEEDAFEQLPEGAFLRGFVRSYARLLQLDEAPLLQALPGEATHEARPAAVPQSVEVPFPGVYSARKSNIIWLAAALLVALALGLFTWLYGRKPAVEHASREIQPVQLPAIPASAVQPAMPVAALSPQSAPAAAAPVDHPKVKLHTSSGSGPIHMVFDEDSWVEVKDKDGNLLMSQVNPAGSEQNLDGTPPFELTIGHANGVKLFYKGKQIDMASHTNSDVAHVTLE